MMVAQRAEGMTLGELLGGAAVGAPPLRVSGLAMDSRAARPGGLFLACRGTQRHGMAFAEAAFHAGAIAMAAEPDAEWPLPRLAATAARLGLPIVPVTALAAQASAIAGRFYGEPSRSLRVVGVTGTNGKTSVSQFLARALAPEGPCAIVGTLGSGLPDALRAGTHTTPDAVSVQAVLADFAAAGARAVAMEVSSHALHQHRVAAVRFDTAVFTNLTRDHLDYHGTMEAYAEAKARLFRHSGLAQAVINTDDPLGLALYAETRARVPVVAYGLGGAPAHADRFVVAERVVADVAGLRLHLRSSWGDGELASPLLGRFNAANLLAVLGVLLTGGVALDDALARLAKLPTVSGRMERLGGGTRPLAVVDYAHTPDALAQALAALREHCAGTLWCVFGCGGDRDRGKRPLMGEVAENLADRVVVTDDNPRSEDGAAIIADILAGMSEPSRVLVERDRDRAIARAVQAARPGDVILVAGKGHEDTQQVGERRFPFSDRLVVQRALAQGTAP